MTARLWTVLVLVAGVFALHGVQCAVGSDAASGHVAGSSVMAAMPAGHALVAAGAAMDAVDGAQPTMAGTVGVAAAPAEPGHHGAPRETAGHVWALCLAVLAAGLAVLLTVGSPRRAGPVPRVAMPVRARVAGVLAPLRPPDLSELCLLRI